MLKAADNPPVLSPAGCEIASLPGKWWVAHTKARFEKAFAWELQHRDIPYFLPMATRVHASGGRKWKTVVPLFSGYVFFNGDDQAKAGALSTNRLCQVVRVPDQNQLIAELIGIHRVVQSGLTIHPLASVAAGSRCRVTAGPLQGMEGTLVRTKAHTRFVLHVSILGQGAELEIEPDLLERVEATEHRTEAFAAGYAR